MRLRPPAVVIFAQALRYVPWMQYRISLGEMILSNSRESFTSFIE